MSNEENSELEDGTQAEDVAPSSDKTGSEPKFRRRTGIALATLAVLGAWIAVIATNAGTNESAAARDATRLASEAQAADVLATGIDDGLNQIEAELKLLPNRTAFKASGGIAESLGAELDPALNAQRLAEAEASVESALGDNPDRPAELATEAHRLSLEQEVVVQQRVEWNAYASQYETVLTVLAVAIFLVGFALVLGPKLRIPVFIPGMILALICLGWALQIYTKPKTEVSDEAISKTAQAGYELDHGQPADAIDTYTQALDSTPDYFEALSGRSLATLVEANPDLKNTVAFTDTSADTVDSAANDIDAALEDGGESDSTALAVGSLVALADSDWVLAAERLEDGIEVNELAAELYLWRSAVAVAQGDEAVAGEWLQDAASRFGDFEPERNRFLAAQYLSLLEYVAERQPDQKELAERFTRLGVETIAEAAADRALINGAGPDATISAATVAFDDGATTLDIEMSDVPDDNNIALVVYERPGADAAWVQPRELFYTGPQGEGGGGSIITPRNCLATEYRLDLYVEGEFRDTVTVAGAEPTC